jgi:AcrR family transcriptional regulator
MTSARQEELLERAYQYALEHGLSDLSLRPLATAIESSPRVLLFLFGSKEGLVKALLARARQEERELLERSKAEQTDLAGVVELLWSWLSAPERRGLFSLWVEAYGRSLVQPEGPWGTFAQQTVSDWLALLAQAQPPARRRTKAGAAERTLALTVLRGALLDVLATGEMDRVSAAVELASRRLH